jgi:hypothetical protein
MPTTAVILESVEYRVILVEPKARAVLALDIGDSYGLPRVRIPKRTRPAQQLQKAIRSTWGLHALILDVVETDGSSLPCVIAELLTPIANRRLEPIAHGQLSCLKLTEGEHFALLSVLGGESKSPFTRIGWLDEAVFWIETATRRKVSSKTDIEQLNSGGAFALVRFPMKDGSDLWLKATGEPNAHELSITSLLSKLCREHVPEILATKPEWNAWIMPAEDVGITDFSMNPIELFRMLEDAVQSMAKLQMKTVGSNSDLLNAGAFDQHLEMLLSHARPLFDYLDEVMELSDSYHTPRLSQRRLGEIRDAFMRAGERVQPLNIPDTVLHGDMSLGNIVVSHRYCQFIDWSEAYVGPCLVTLEHMLLLNRVENPKVREIMNCALKEKYLDVWTAEYDPDALRQGFDYMPLIAVIAALYGRGDWLNSPKRYDAHCLSYARTLAACMDRARPRLERSRSIMRCTSGTDGLMAESCARSYGKSLVSAVAGHTKQN